MSAEAGDTSDDSPMTGSYPLSNRFPQYGRANGVLLTKIIDEMMFTCFNPSYVVVGIGIGTWTYVYPAFIRLCVLLTSEPRFVRNALYWLRNLVIPAPANTYHDAVRFLRDTAPDGNTNLPFPSFYEGYVWHKGRSWEVSHGARGPEALGIWDRSVLGRRRVDGGSTNQVTDCQIQPLILSLDKTGPALHGREVPLQLNNLSLELAYIRLLSSVELHGGPELLMQS